MGLSHIQHLYIKAYSDLTEYTLRHADSSHKNICISQSGIYFLPFFYCVKSPCTNPAALLLSSGPWKWTTCKTCGAHISQISTEPTPTPNIVASFKYTFLCILCSIGRYATVQLFWESLEKGLSPLGNVLFFFLKNKNTKSVKE